MKSLLNPNRDHFMRARFTIDGSDGLESHLARICERVRGGLYAIIPPSKIDGVVLGGGYGRGEGGVLKSESGDQSYNDLEFYVFIKGNRLLNQRRFGGAL